MQAGPGRDSAPFLRRAAHGVLPPSDFLAPRRDERVWAAGLHHGYARRRQSAHGVSVPAARRLLHVTAEQLHLDNDARRRLLWSLEEAWYQLLSALCALLLIDRLFYFFLFLILYLFDIFFILVKFFYHYRYKFCNVCLIKVRLCIYKRCVSLFVELGIKNIMEENMMQFFRRYTGKKSMIDWFSISEIKQ